MTEVEVTYMRHLNRYNCNGGFRKNVNLLYAYPLNKNKRTNIYIACISTVYLTLVLVITDYQASS